jgi:hypothetical protein
LPRSTRPRESLLNLAKSYQWYLRGLQLGRLGEASEPEPDELGFQEEDLCRRCGRNGSQAFPMIVDPCWHRSLRTLGGWRRRRDNHGRRVRVERTASLRSFLAALFAPFVKTFGGNDAALFFEMRAELPSAHSVRAGIERWRTRLSPGASHVNPEASKNHTVPCYEDGHGFGWRDIRIELEIDARPAVEVAGNIRPFPDRTEAIAHGRKLGIEQPESSGAPSRSDTDDQRLFADECLNFVCGPYRGRSSFPEWRSRLSSCRPPI